MTFIPKNHEINLLHEDSEKIYRKFVESAQAGIYMTDREGTLFFINQTFVNILGYNTKEEILGKNLAKELYVNPQERAVFLRAMESRGFVMDYEVRNKRKDGSVAVLSATSNFIYGERGQAIGVEGIVHDITDKKKLEESLTTEKKKLEQILFFDERVSAIHDLEELIDFVINKISEILEVEKCSLMILDQVTGELCIKGARGLNEEVIANSRVKLGEGIAGIVAKEGVPLLIQNIEYDRLIQRKSKPYYRSESFISLPIKVYDKVIGVLNVTDKRKDNRYCVFEKLDLKILSAMSREISISLENVQMYKELKYLTEIDPLTNIYNFRKLTKSLDYEIFRVKRFKGALSLMMIDVDDFKSYNDTYGHVEGDNLLKELSMIFVQNFREVDIICRYAGDEFSIILPGTDLPGAQKSAEKVQKIIREATFKRKITVSIGITRYNDSMKRYDLILKADRALYEAKKQGKDRVYSLG